MDVKEVYLEWKELGKLMNLVEKELLSNPDTQIFLSTFLYQELQRSGNNFNIHSYHYPDGRECLALTTGLHFEKVLSKCRFKKNSNNFLQMVEFTSAKIKDYKSKEANLNQLVLIDLKVKKF